MEKIYHEAIEKSGQYRTNSPCISVRAYIPDRDDDFDLPGIIILESGRVTEHCAFHYDNTMTITEENAGKPTLICKAIEEFDKLKKAAFADD